MKIFISWSGDLSHEVAKLLKDWLKCVLQATEPWLSSSDMQRGSIWFDDISDALKDCSTGIVCLTKGNLKAPWILFESGGLLKGLATNRVCTFLVNLEPKDVEPPLSQFNHTIAKKDNVFELVKTLNNRLEQTKLEPETLEKVFDMYWPQFENDLKKILSEVNEERGAPRKRSSDDILTEILYAVRRLDFRLNKIERGYDSRKVRNDFLYYEDRESKAIKRDEETERFICARCKARTDVIHPCNGHNICLDCAIELDIVKKMEPTDEESKRHVV